MNAAILGLEPVRLSRKPLYQALSTCAQGLPNDEIFASILSTWMVGEGALPACLGMEPAVFQQLLDRHFPGTDEYIALDDYGLDADQERLPEREELLNLLLRYRAGKDVSEIWVAEIVVAACMGSDHLWQDLGLWSRDQLSSLLSDNFPDLAALNIKNMKWKKFLYKQLCQEEGIYVCRAPSCEVCKDYAVCFGPEN